MWDLSFGTFSFIIAFPGKQKRQQLIQFLEAEIKVWDLLIFFFLLFDLTQPQLFPTIYVWGEKEGRQI